MSFFKTIILNANQQKCFSKGIQNINRTSLINQQSIIRNNLTSFRRFQSTQTQTKSSNVGVVENSNIRYDLKIGLEIHAQISSKSKLFSDSRSTNRNESISNTSISIFDCSLPGTLPVLNKFCVEQAIKAGIALNGEISKQSMFDRKHYFYADLPHGFQITQQKKPVVEGGYLDIPLESKSSTTRAPSLYGSADTKRVKIQRIQLEMDSGKSQHEGGSSLIDLNRAGVGLLEIVSDPDMTSATEASSFVRKLQHLLRHIGVCEGNMERGELRCDVNVSVHPNGGPGVRCEIKNINSTKHVQKAVEYEYQRHVDLLKKGQKIARETRFWDASTNSTISLREKETDVDYRFMPEPDLLPLLISQKRVSQVNEKLRELPQITQNRLAEKYGLNSQDIDTILEHDVVDYFETVANGVGDAKRVSSWIINELFGLLNDREIELEQISKVMPPRKLESILRFVKENAISVPAAKAVMNQIIIEKDEREPNEIIEQLGLKQQSDESLLDKFCESVLTENEAQVKEYETKLKQNQTVKAERSIRFFVGQVMKLSQGKANPRMVTELIQRKLNERINK